MHAEYRNALVKADRDEKVRAIVVTGSGRAFCVGGDSAALDDSILSSFELDMVNMIQVRRPKWNSQVLVLMTILI